MRAKSRRIDFAGRLLWGGVAPTWHAAAIFTSLLATCGALALGGVNAVSAQELAYSESFDSYGQVVDPPGWFDSAPGNPVEEAPGLFKIWPDPAGGGNRVFGKRGAADTFTHLRSRQFPTSSRFELTARVWRGRDSGSFGWTFFSTFPSPPAYFRIRQLASGGGLRLESSGLPAPVGDLEGEVRARPLAWYRLRLLSEPQGAGLRLRVRIWDSALAEPESWQIDAVTASRPSEGAIGLWSAGAGGCYWDDLAVSAAPSEPLVLRVLEGGVELADGALFSRDVVPVLETTGGTAPIALDATLDGAPFTSGSTVTGDGLHLLEVSAEDAGGFIAQRTVQFTIDTLGPVFVSVAPPEGFVTSSSAVVLAGEVAGATTLTVNGAPVLITNDLWSSELLALAEGAQTFLLVASDLAGNSTPLARNIVRDSLSPGVTISQPAPGVVGSSPITVAGTATDPHLAQVLVNGQAAAVAGASYSLAGLALVEGSNEIVVEAFDAVGNPPGSASVAVTLDTQEPVLTFLESGLPLADGALFNRTVVPVVVATDATQVNLSVTLNGAPFASGTPVAEEGSYTLQATAVDEGGSSANLAVSFVIDETAPSFVSVVPPDNTLVALPEIALSGEVAGAQSVTVDGLPCTLTTDQFICPPFPLADGERIFQLRARDAAGNEAPRSHRIRRDGTGPDLVITTPADGAYLSSPEITVAGTAVDPHLAEVRVNGVLADLVGDAWTAGPISFAEGAATIQVTARDTVDNATVLARAVTIDTLAPEIEILESGDPLSEGALFNRAVTPVIVVTDASPWTLVATLDGAPYGSGTPVASEGLHVLQATATDSAANPTTRQVSFRVDGSPPALVTIAPADGFVTAEAEIHLQGQILGAETLTIDGSPVTLLGDQFVAGPYTLAEGERTFALVARDAAGNELSRAHHVVRDITAPTVSIQQPAANALVGTNAVQVTGQAADPHLASIAVNGVAASLSGATWVAPHVALAEGESTLVATAVDRAGNSATASRVVVRDSQAPVLTITDPAAGSVVPDAEVVVSGSVDEPNLDRVTVQGVTAAVQGGSFSASVALVEGDNTLVARATDRLGHAAEATRLVRRDSTAPGLEIYTPEEGSRIAAESVAVSGTIAEENGINLTVNGVAATIAGGTFSAAAVPLIEGENRLIARARDANGNEGVRTRTVVRDTVAPTLLGTEPPAGALAIALATVFAAELSEEPGPASVAGMRLETGAGAALAATVEIVGTGLRLTPATPLPSSGLVRLVLDAGIVDLAGNALAAGATFEFTTADATAPAAPTIPAPPARFLCADVVTLAGFAEPDLWVEVAGGAGAARVRAGSDGAFSLAVPLIPGAIHRLAVTSVDDAGNRSPATEIEVVHDCAAPIVETIDASATGFAIRFSEEIEPASFAGSIVVSSAAGAIAGSVALDVDLATFTAAAALPEGAIRVEVLRQPRDLAGNLLAYPWVAVFGGDVAESFFVATVIDDAVGRPLAGARARVLATNGVPPSGAEPALESTSDSDGAVSVPVPVGTHLVIFERPDSTPVFRFVTTQAQQGADVVDPRLTPLSAAVAVGPAGGAVAAGVALSLLPAELQLPAGALAEAISISLTELSEQGLPRLLPFGWSPRAAVWIGPEEAPLLLPAILTLQVDASPGSTVAWVHLDPATRVWRVEGVTALGVTELVLPVAEAGAWAVVEADPPPFAVPAAVVGEPLGSLPAPPAPSDTLLGATLAFDPETVLPGQRSRATVDYTATEAAASGSTVTLSIAEELQLLDGTTRTEPPYRADLVVYRTAEGARSRFFLASSEAARLLPLELGEENVAVLPYGGEVVRGNVLGPQGGSVLDPSGDRIDIPAGALVRPTPVQLEPATEGSLPLPVPQGFAFAGALRLDLSGETLLEPATLFLALAEPPSAGETGILFGVESPAGGDYAWRPLVTITPSGSGWQSDPILPVDLAWPGVTRGGLYLFARALTPLGFVRGTVFDVGGAPLANAVVASTDAPAVAWIQLSGGDGRYAFPAWVGPVALTATKPSTGDQGSGNALIAAGGERVDLDLLLAIVRPAVVSTTPASGATGVPVGIEPVVQFSEPVERSSLAAAITLRPVDGAPLTFDLHHLGSQVTLEPEVSLAPETTYELVIGEGVRDLQGHGMAASVTVAFTTQSVTLPSTVDLSRVLLYAPGTNGESRIQGLPGAAPAGTLVFVENLTRLAATNSVAADQDGSFELSIVAQVTDRLLLHVLIPGGNEAVAILGPFRTADGRGAYVGAEGSTFTTIDGWTFTVPADAFDETSIVHVVPRAVGQLPTPLPASFVEGVSFALDFGGATLDKAIELALPAPAGAPAGRPILVLREVRAAGEHGWMLHELATQEGGRVATLAAGAAPFSAELFAEPLADSPRGEAGSGASLAELAARAPGAMLPGIAFAGNYTISWTPEPLGFLGFPTIFWNDAYVETALTGIVTVLNRAIELLLEHDAVLIPTLLGNPVAVTVHDGTTGFVLYEGEFSPPPEDGDVVEIPPATFGDTTAPYPFAGTPLRLFVLDAAEAAGGELDRGVSYLFTDEAIEITGESGAVTGDARVRLLGLDDERSSYTSAATDGSFELQASITAGNRYLLMLGARIDATAALEIEWSELLGDELEAVRVLDGDDHEVGADVDFGDERSTVVIKPRGGWPTDRDLRLELGPALADAAGNSWNKTLELDFRARESKVVGHYPFEHVYDVVRMGELIFLATGQQGLAVLDASNPAELTNVMPEGLTFPLPYSDVVRGLAVDSHGRVLVAGGGVANFGVLRIFDPLALPEILAAPDPAAARGLAWRGTTIVSDRLGGTGTQLPSGTPRKVALYSDDLKSSWRVEEAAPEGLEATYTAGEGGALGTLAVSGSGAVDGAPVSLRNLTRAAFARVDADGTGAFSVSIAAASGDRIELLRNRATIAYLATLGAGVEAVDVNAFYHGTNEPSPVESAVLGVYSGIGDASLELCNESVADLASALIGLDLLVEAAASPPIDVTALVGFRGIAEIESPPSEMGNLSFLTDACAEVEGSRAVRALAAEVDLPWDSNADGRVDSTERERDYVFVTHATGGLLVFDLTQRSEPQLVARIRLPLVAFGVAIDRTRMRAYVSGASGGIAIVDLAALATTTFVDVDENDVDDRVLEVVPIAAIQPGSPAVALPELGLVFVGGDGGAASLAVGVPEIVFVAADGSNDRLTEIAPLGVPSREVGTPEAPRQLPASFRIRVALPAAQGAEIELDVAGIGPGGEPVDDAGDLTGLPRSRLEGDGSAGTDTGVVLHRLSDNLWEEGVHWYESEVLVAVADLRAAKDYLRTEREDDPDVPGSCVRCDREALEIPESAREILSGDAIRVSFPETMITALAGTYEADRLREAAATVASVRWETAPSMRQEPAQNPSLGSGDVVPGTLLHSGELSQGAVDLAVTGRGLDFAFARTYRSQTVGGGPLGPGWDFGYRMRLRKLPTGDVELYDGRGRRETFEEQEDKTLKAPAGVFLDLEKKPSGYLLLDPAHTLVRFDVWGRLMSISDATKDRESRGNEMRFFYDAHSRLTSVLDALGREYKLEYDDEDGRLTTLTDFDEREVVYSYDTEGCLETVRSPRITSGETQFPEGLTTTYEYETPGGELAGQLASRDNLTSVTDPRGGPQDKPFEATYTDADGDARAEEVTAERWGDHPLSIAYDFEERSAMVTDRRANLWRYQHGETGQVMRIEDPTSAATQIEVDDEGLVKKVTKPLGGVTEITYDTEGPRRSRGNALAVAVTADSRGDNGSAHTLTTIYEYEGYSNQPTKITDPRGAVTAIVRNEVGLAKEITEAQGTAEAGRTTLDYNDYGQPTTVTNPNEHVTTYAYFETGESEGYLQKRTVDPGGLGLETVYETDPRGNVKSVTDPRGVRHESTYNEVDWLVETIAAASASSDGAPALNLTTKYLHDENGNVIEEQIPFGDDGNSFTRVERDYGVLNEVKEERREIAGGDVAPVRFDFDEAFNRIRVTHPEGNIEEWDYDSRNLIERHRRGLGSGALPAPIQTVTSYDAEGAPIAFEDGRHFGWQTTYDGFGRVLSQSNPLTESQETTYDTGGLPATKATKVGGAVLAKTLLAFDLRGRLKEQTGLLWESSALDPRIPDSVDTAIQVKQQLLWDAASNLRTVIDPFERSRVWERDAAERVTRQSDPAGNVTEWALDSAGNATTTTSIEAASGGGSGLTIVSAAVFDALARPLQVTDAYGNSVQRTFDARGNVVLEIDPEGALTTAEFDGLDRLVSRVRPEGISERFVYDRNSRLVEYRDASERATTYAFDAADRLTQVTYPDSTTRVIEELDDSGNVLRFRDANGSSVTQGFDAANRLRTRAIARGGRVEGVAFEGYDYDGLSRLTRAQSGSIVTTFDHDSLSNLLRETTDGKSTSYQRDDVGNPLTTVYPSGLAVAAQFEALNRPSTLGTAGSPAAFASFRYRGESRLLGRTVGSVLVETRVLDAVGRPQSLLVRAGASPARFWEQTSFSPRSLASASTRWDLTGKGEAHRYDAAGRLTLSETTQEPTEWIANNAVSPPATLESIAEGAAFAYSTAEHLEFQATKKEAQRSDKKRIVEINLLPEDASGRHRPGFANDKLLLWDGSGNLIRKGEFEYFYDYRNRLSRVTRDGVGEIATYDYDALNRRTYRRVAGEERQTVWSGWRSIEEYAEAGLASRRVFGLGLDDMVRQEVDTDADGVLDATQLPLYDRTGNLVVLTNASGTPIERYEYDPYGPTKIEVDNTPPQLAQIRRSESGTVVVEFSEGLSGEALREKLGLPEPGASFRVDGLDLPVIYGGAGPLGLVGGETALERFDGGPTVTLDWVEVPGRESGRAFRLTPSTPIAAGSTVEITFEAAAIEDFFANLIPQGITQTFVWPGEAAAITDSAAPEVERIVAMPDRVEVLLSEPVTPASVAAAITVDGESRSWTDIGSGYRFQTTLSLPPGPHAVDVSTALQDLAGKPPTAALSVPFTMEGAQSQIPYEKPDPQAISTSAAQNVYGWKGLPRDRETGFVYVRNRYYDPEIGRFITADPLGYVDGPSTYGFAANEPINNGDPLGLACTTEHGGTNGLCNPMDGMELSSRSSWWDITKAVAAETAGNSLTEALFLNTIADAPHAGLDPTLPAGARAWGVTKGAAAVVTNLGGTAAALQSVGGRLLATKTARWIATEASQSYLGHVVTQALTQDVRVLGSRLLRYLDDSVPAIDVERALGSSTSFLASLAERGRRFATARDFYRAAGWRDASIAQHLRGIDFSKSVEQVVLVEGTEVLQFVLPGRGVGNYFSPLGTAGNTAGIYTSGRVPSIFVATQDATVLRSVAADTVADWEVEQWLVEASGGAVQYFAPSKALFAPRP